MLKQARVYIIGDVIGVGFRAWTKIQAKILQVKGWVRNNYERPEVFGRSGGVEALLQAEEETIAKMVDTLKEGPPVSRVEDVQIFPEEPKEILDIFEIIK